MWGAVIGDPRQGTCAATVSDRAIDCQEDTAVSLEEHKRRERAQAIGLFRYQLICPALEAGLSTRQRGRVVREIAGRRHIDPFHRGKPWKTVEACAPRSGRRWRA